MLNSTEYLRYVAKAGLDHVFDVDKPIVIVEIRKDYSSPWMALIEQNGERQVVPMSVIR